MSTQRILFPVLIFTACLWLWLLVAREAAAQGGDNPTAPPGFEIDGAELPLIDDQAGRIYINGYLEGRRQALALALEDGRLLARYDYSGKLALDSLNGRLYIDQDLEGLVVINTRTGRLQKRIKVPGPPYASAAPQADPASGRVLAFRGNKVYLVEPGNGLVTETISLNIPNSNGEITNFFQAGYDPSARILYLDVVINGCHSSMGGDCSTHTLVSYDLTAQQEITRADGGPLGQLFEGYMYYQDFRCPGASCTGWRTLWRGGRPWHYTGGWKDRGGPLAFDPARQRFYEVTDDDLRLYEAETMALIFSLPRPRPGTFIRYHASSDSLQFWHEGRLQSWPVANIRPPLPEALTPSATPTTSVEFLALSPEWPAEPLLVAGWADPYTPKPGMIIGDQFRFECGFPNLAYVSQDKGQSWSRPRGGLAGSCELGAPLAISPNYSRDKTLLAGVSGLGIFKSTDGGRLWLPSGKGLTQMSLSQLLLSPAFAEDQTAFTRGNYDRNLYRSRDGGRSWQTLAFPAPDQEGYGLNLALSSEFPQDQTLLVLFFDYEQVAELLYRSQDGGDQWSLVAPMPEGIEWRWLSLAPLFAKWRTLFAAGWHEDHGVLYRSTDGGQTWSLVLETGSEVARSLVYAAEIEEDRPIFLLAAGILYSSTNGGSTWQKLELANGISPTALTISPTFAEDRMLFLGTVRGQVLTWAVPE